MRKLKIKRDPRVNVVLKKYPNIPRQKLKALRKLIIEEAEDVRIIEETLKWGELSYLTEYGNTIRIDWKEKSPDQYAIYFKCTSKLVPTFKKLFGDSFIFEANRAIIFQLDEEIPNALLKKCIKTALCYHKVKHLPKLGLE